MNHKKILSIEILRGLAATLVVFVHVIAETQFRSVNSTLVNFFETISSKMLKLMLVIGSSSYSIYLSHNFVLKAVYRFIPNSFVSNHPDVVITIVLIITVLFGIFVYYLIEIPLLRHTKKIFFFNKKSKNIL
jgi:peptidoglycan/LPS O-acetylase OafA/YrhL